MHKRIIYIFAIILFSGLHIQGQNITRPNIQAPSGIEINSFTGNLFYQRTDLYLPAPGLPIDITFSYNSYRDTIDWGYGLGWTFSYNYRYYPDTVGSPNFIVERPDGRRDLFTYDGSDYQAPTGIFDTWTKVEPGKYQLSTKYGMNYFFEDSSHRQITKITEPNGNTISFTYDAGKLMRIDHSSGRQVLLNWRNDHLLQIIDPNTSPKREWLYIYEETNLMRIALNPLFRAEEYVYNGNNLITNITDRNQDPTYIVFDASNRVKRVKSCDSELSITYAVKQGKTYVVERGSAGEHLTRYTFDETGNVVEKQGNCCGFNTSYDYDDEKNIHKLTDGNGNLTSYGYDTHGNVLAMVDPLGGTRTFSYESTFNNLSQLTDKNGNRTNFSYDANGNLTQIQRPSGISEQYNYHNDGQVSTYTDGNNLTTRFTYNQLGDLTKINYPNNTEETFTYDGIGNLTGLTNPNGDSLSMKYDALDRLTQITDPLGNQQRFRYDHEDNLTKIIDENGYGTDYIYDGLDRLIGVKDSAGWTQYAYDGVGNLTQMIDANGHTSTFNYNGDNLLVSESDPEGNKTEYTYDSNRNLIQKIDPNGHITTYTYDALNRLIGRSYNGNKETFSYDAEGNLTASSNNHIQMVFTYDALNRLTSKTVVNWGKTISYTYDAVGNRATMTDPDGGLTTYIYAGNHQLIQIIGPGGNRTTFGYDASGKLTRQINGNGTNVNYQYDDADRVTLIEHRDGSQLLKKYAYTYDARGNRLSMTDLSGTHRYSYDGSYRLDSVQYADGSTEYFAYDHTGNRTQLLKDGIGTQYTYDAADRLQTAGNASFTFDANGNMTARFDSIGMTTYTYDGQDRLIEVTLPNGKTISYQYDPFGNRIAMRDTSGQTTRYFLDGANPLMELSTNGQTQARYTSALAMDSWLSMTRDGETYYYHQDALGSVKALTNGAKEVILNYDYDAFGTIRAQSGEVKNPFTYTGREWNEEVGMYYYRKRFYDYKTGRFISQDKQRSANKIQINNKYIYVENNSINYVDPNGLSPLRLISPLIHSFSSFKDIYKEAHRIGKEFSKTNFHIYRNCFNKTPVNTSLDSQWQKEPDYKNWYHQPGLGAWNKIWDLIFDPSDGLPYDKYILQDLDGPGSSEIILGPDGAIISNGPEQGSYNYFHPNGTLERMFMHWVFDMIPHKYNSNYKDCSTYPGEQEFFKNPFKESENWNIPIIQAIDPNEIIGSAGYDSAQWVSINDTLKYTILFENDPDFATAPAQIVEIFLPLDEHINPLSLRLKEFGFGDFIFSIPAGTGFYQKRLDSQKLIDSLGVIVEMTAGLDLQNNRAFWRFESLHPNTLLPPVDASLGFLPVNDSLTHKGEGFVSFTVVPVPSAQSGDTIHEQAEIIFDDNPPILTNTHFNTIDALPPDLVVASMIPGGQNSMLLDIRFSDDSTGSGPDTYDLFLATTGEPMATLGLNIRQDTLIRIKGLREIEHCLYAIASDYVGNTHSYMTESLTCFMLQDTAYVNFLYPQGGEQFCGGKQITIRWEEKNIDLIGLEYSRDNGRTYHPIIDHLSPGDSTYVWNIPIDFTASDSVLISGYTGRQTESLTAKSALFSIESTPAPLLIPNNTTLCEGDSILLSTAQTYFRYRWNTGATTPTLLVNTAGSYALQVIGFNGCASPFSEEVEISISPFPDKPSIVASGSVDFCAGDSVVLLGPAGYNYLWSTGAETQEITVFSSGTFSLSVVSENSCVSPTSDPIFTTANVRPARPTIFAAGSLTFFAGNSVTLHGPAGYQYLWSTGETTQSIMVYASGAFSLTVYDSEGCESPVSLPVITRVVSQDAGPATDKNNTTTNALLSETIHIYPNPNKGKFVLTGEVPLANDVQIRITDHRGREINSMKATIQNGLLYEVINLEDQPEGIYNIILEAQGEQVSYSVVIVR